MQRRGGVKESRKRESLSTCWRHNEGPLVKPFTAEGDYKVTEELGMAISVLQEKQRQEVLCRVKPG